MLALQANLLNHKGHERYTKENAGAQNRLSTFVLLRALCGFRFGFNPQCFSVSSVVSSFCVSSDQEVVA